MPVIPSVGRRSFKVRFLVTSIYVVLLIGAVTMVYPFMLMLAGTTKSGIDTSESKVIPEYLINDVQLYRKDCEAFFNEDLTLMKMAFGSEAYAFRVADPPSRINRKLVDQWIGCMKEQDLPFFYYSLGYISVRTSKGTLPSNLRKFQDVLYQQFNGDLDRMNSGMETEFREWGSFYIIPENYLNRRTTPNLNIFFQEYRKFEIRQPENNRYYFSPEGYFKHCFLMTMYGRKIEDYNETHNTDYKSWDEVQLPRTYPAARKYTDSQRADWNDFVRNVLNLFWIRADPEAQIVYQEFLEAKHQNLQNLNKNYDTVYKTFQEIPLVGTPYSAGMASADWGMFISGWQNPKTGKEYKLPGKMMYIHGIDFIFRDYLKSKYGAIKQLNTALNTNYTTWLDITPPQKDAHYLYFKKHSMQLKWEYTKRNYIAVAGYILLHGRGVYNTAIYCILQILCALTINPLAAYGLSRFKPPSSYKLLLFLMLTMAFPPMVTQIPMFMMLREFNLLNTFWALILPGMANGYSIFLLKGFFDSQPRELYESAMIDGAGEFRIFWQFTMALSKPILAVIALNAFTLAYSNFMMAMLICQDQKMWTLLPWLYQLQQRSCQGVVFASLIIAAIPTFIVFALCQNVIMRGIVVPVEK